VVGSDRLRPIMTKAVILAAGKGTRMGDLTQEIPKPMLSVQGRPILEHIVEGLKEVGVREFHLITAGVPRSSSRISATVPASESG